MTARSLSSGILSLLPSHVHLACGKFQADRMILLELALDELAAYFGQVVFDHSLRIWRARLVTARRLVDINASFSSHNNLRPVLLCVRFTRCQTLDAGCQVVVRVTNI